MVLKTRYKGVLLVDMTIYGDSILKGVLLEDGRYTVDRGWNERLSRSCGVRVCNRARFGCTIRKALSLIRRDSERAYEAGEVALLEFGGNDCDYDWGRIAAEPAGAYDCKTPPEQFLRGYREAIALVRQSGRTPVLVNLPPIDSERYLSFICRDGLSRQNILAWLGDVDAIFRWQKKYSDMATELAREQRVRLVDLRGAFLRDGRRRELLCADGIHPSRSGQSLIFHSLEAGLA